MDKLEKVIKGFNIRHMLDSFFNKYIKKHFNEAHSEDYIESDLGDNISATAKYIKILGGQHIETFLRSLISNNVGTDASYNNLVVQVIKDDNIYEGVVEKTDVNSSSIVLRPFEAFGVAIEMPAKVRLFTNPILTSDAKSSIVYNAVVAGESKYNLILGERNIHKGKDDVVILGKNNVSKNRNQSSLIVGYSNNVNSYHNLVVGDNNTVTGDYGGTIGTSNCVYKKNNFIIGKNSWGEAVGGGLVVGDCGFLLPETEENWNNRVGQIFACGGGGLMSHEFAIQKQFTNAFAVYKDGGAEFGYRKKPTNCVAFVNGYFYKRRIWFLPNDSSEFVGEYENVEMSFSEVRVFLQHTTELNFGDSFNELHRAVDFNFEDERRFGKNKRVFYRISGGVDGNPPVIEAIRVTLSETPGDDLNTVEYFKNGILGRSEKIENV